MRTKKVGLKGLKLNIAEADHQRVVRYAEQYNLSLSAIGCLALAEFLDRLDREGKDAKLIAN